MPYNRNCVSCAYERIGFAPDTEGYDPQEVLRYFDEVPPDRAEIAASVATVDAETAKLFGVSGNEIVDHVIALRMTGSGRVVHRPDAMSDIEETTFEKAVGWATNRKGYRISFRARNIPTRGE